jgi:hypothetical protein
VAGRQGRGGGHRTDGQVDGGEVAVGFDPQSRAAHGFPGPRGFVQGRGQVAPQPFPGHLQDVVDAALAGGGLQVHAGAAVEVEDVALGVDQGPGLDDLLQQACSVSSRSGSFPGTGRLFGGCGSASSGAVMGGRNRPGPARWAPRRSSLRW